MSGGQHLTTRRGFVTALGFGGTSLYAIWVGYGSSPSPLALFAGQSEAEPGHLAEPSASAHAEHGGSPEDEATSALDEFRARLDEFTEKYALPDGSVYPRPGQTFATGAHSDSPRRGVAEADALQLETGGHGSDHRGAPELAPAQERSSSAESVEVLLLAAQFYFEPDHLRLDAGQPYRFRMMAAETAHGASIQFGQGGRMIRLRPGSAADAEMTFQEPGDYLVTCTVYCGAGHDAMQARITVANGEGGAA